MEHELDLLANALAIPVDHVRLVFGAIDESLKARLIDRATEIATLIETRTVRPVAKRNLVPAFTTALGSLYQGDCIDVLGTIPDSSVDLVFADPPFNLRKIYESGIDDDLSETEYLQWCETWLDECCRVLRPGGSLFVWNIPRWCTYLSSVLNSRLTFRNWIAVDIKYSLPISRRLYPSHYGLLYYVKGVAPDTFVPDRMPMATCPKCGVDLKDYGGYKAKMNPRGVSLGDVWTDISPVRHSKYKKRKEANELPIRLLDRVIEMASSEGQIVLDPFGGAGTTYAVAEMKGRQWIGAEIGSIDQIVDRFANLDEERSRLAAIRSGYNRLFQPSIEKIRKERGLWTCDDFHGADTLSSDDAGPLFSKSQLGKR